MPSYRLHISYNPKPIPTCKFDWEAWWDDDPEHGAGYGLTSEAAVMDLLTDEEYSPEVLDATAAANPEFAEPILKLVKEIREELAREEAEQDEGGELRCPRRE